MKPTLVLHELDLPFDIDAPGVLKRDIRGVKWASEAWTKAATRKYVQQRVLAGQPPYLLVIFPPEVTRIGYPTLPSCARNKQGDWEIVFEDVVSKARSTRPSDIVSVIRDRVVGTFVDDLAAARLLTHENQLRQILTTRGNATRRMNNPRRDEMHRDIYPHLALSNGRYQIVFSPEVGRRRRRVEDG